MTMKAISLWQPWASWIMWGWKMIETRTHDRFRSLEGETIAIHAARRHDKRGFDLASDYLADWQLARCVIEEPFPTGVILCTAKVECVGWCVENDARFALIECNSRRFGLYLKHIRVYPEPVPCKGKQGIFNIDL